MTAGGATDDRLTVHINGEATELAEGATVRAVLDLLGVDTGARGIAVAVDAEVVPRSEWSERVLADGERVEILIAVQGG
jgi:sulfur carrier protein